MSEIKYVSPSTLTHYDEKIKDIIDDKVDKIDGKGLSANDLTNELKTEYDDTVAKAHEHSNIDVLKKFSEDSNGMPLYDNDKFYDGLVANDLTTTDEGYALDARQGKVLGDRVSELETPTFTQATTRANIASGESTKTILGKIKKYFADLKSHAFNAPANNLTTTTTGYALDARQGKALQDKLGSTDISEIGDGTVTNAISTINSNLEYIETTKCSIPQTIGGLIDYSPYTSQVTGFSVVTIKAWHDQTLPLDGNIFLNGEAITSGYFTHKYQTLSVTIPVKVGDVISCTEGFNFILRTIF